MEIENLKGMVTFEQAFRSNEKAFRTGFSQGAHAVLDAILAGASYAEACRWADDVVFKWQNQAGDDHGTPEWKRVKT